MERPHYLNPAGSAPPVGQYTNVAIVPAGAATAYVAGVLPVDDSGGVLGDTFAEQADAVFATLANSLEGSGSSLSQVAFIRAFLVDEDDLPAFREARARAFERHGVTEPPPATTIVVRGLIGGSLIELDAVAAV